MTDDLKLLKVTIEPVVKLWSSLEGGVSVEVSAILEYSCNIDFGLAFKTDGVPSISPTSNHAAELIEGAGNFTAELAEQAARKVFETLKRKGDEKKITPEPRATAISDIDLGW